VYWSGEGEHPNKTRRKQIESGGNYATYTGNGYVGAYQFVEAYMPGRMAEAGLGAYDRNDFLNSPWKQDALADWYALTRYGGWDNVPMSGGW
jgi:hypothetical protein